MLYVTCQNNTLAYLIGFEIETTDILWLLYETDKPQIPTNHLYLAVSGEGHIIWTLSWQKMFALASCGIRGTCDEETFVCDCNSKWEGSDCSVCKNDCSYNGYCNVDGDCVCLGHWDGSSYYLK